MFSRSCENVKTFVVLETPGGGVRPRPRHVARTSVGRAPKPAGAGHRWRAASPTLAADRVKGLMPADIARTITL